MVYLRARYYSPGLERFTAPDPLVTAGIELPGISPYAYGEDNPLSNLDPSGLVAETVQAARTSWAGTAVSIGSSFVPGLGDMKDMLEVLTGRDLVTGQKLTGMERLITVAATLIPFVGASALRKVISEITAETGEMAARKAARIVGEEVGVQKAYHYTSSEAAKSIGREGLRAGESGMIFATTTPDLSPLQAQIDLALRPNRPLPDAVFEIDTRAVKERGIVVTGPKRVTAKFNMPGGGEELLIEALNLPVNVIQRVR